LSTQEGREFLRGRVARYGMIAATFGAAFWISRVVSAAFSDRLGELASPSVLAHGGGVLLMMLLWLSCRRGPRAASFVRAMELACIAGTSVAYCALVIGLPQSYRPDVKLVQGLAIQLLGRAVYIPSSPRRTALLGAITTLPYVAAIVWTFHDLDAAFVRSLHAVQEVPSSDFEIRANLIGEDILWWIGINVVAIWISAVIFGLRREVRQAKRLGQYTLEAKLGQGGMGIVYRGHHAMLRRPTAIKLLQPDRIGEASLARFEREVRATAALSHPNTVTIYDYGRTPEGTFYYAMELLDGATLTQIVRLSGPMPPARVVHVLVQVAGALAEAHGGNLIHRDIKPDNILLTRRGGLFDFAKVVDFGLVKELDASEAIDLTHENAILGTPLYMAPECIRGKALRDGRSDLYALGAVGYFLITGEHVFEGESVLEICGQHLERKPEPPSARLGAPVPADLEAILLDCLAKRPEERPKSALELEQRLRACESYGGWTSTDAERWWRDYGPELEPQETSLADTIAVDLAGRNA
jgi:serine/threonine-protein kinase